MRALLLTAGLMFGVGSLVRAEPLELHQISADAKWLAHLDGDAVRASILAQRVYQQWLGRDPAKQRLEQFRKTFGISLTRDLRSISFYGTRLAPQSGVAIVRAKMDRRRLLDLLDREPGHRTSSYGKHALHCWTDAEGKEDEQTVTGCFHRPTVAVIGRDAEEVKAALDVLDGKSPSLAESDSRLKMDAPAGAIFEARATSLAAADLPFKSPLVRQTELLAIVLGEHQGKVFGQVRLVASEAAPVEQVRAVVEGLRAIAQLQHADDEDVMQALQAVQVTTEEKTVTVQWRLPVDDVLKLVEKEWHKRQPPKQAD